MTMSAAFPHLFGDWESTVATVGVIGVIAGVSFGAAYKLFDARLALWKDRADEYKRKLDGASADEAKARLESLEAQVAELSSRDVLDEFNKAVGPGMRVDRGGGMSWFDNSGPGSTGKSG